MSTSASSSTAGWQAAPGQPERARTAAVRHPHHADAQTPTLEPNPFCTCCPTSPSDDVRKGVTAWQSPIAIAGRSLPRTALNRDNRRPEHDHRGPCDHDCRLAIFEIRGRVTLSAGRAVAERSSVGRPCRVRRHVAKLGPVMAEGLGGRGPEFGDGGCRPVMPVLEDHGRTGSGRALPPACQLAANATVTAHPVYARLTAKRAIVPAGRHSALRWPRSACRVEMATG